MSEDTKTGFKTEGDPAFPVESTENDNSAESSTEKTAEDQTQSQGGEKENTGDQKKDDQGADNDFTKHPRWQEREDDWKKRFNEQETRHTDAIEKLREEIVGKVGDKKTETKADLPAMPSWWGGDEDQWAEYCKHQDALVAQAEERAITRITSKQTEEQNKIKEATDFMNEEVTKIESDKTINPNSEKVDRNKLLKFVLDNDLVDSKGRWNYRAGFLMMKSGVSSTKDEKKETTDEKKKIASATTSENRAETKPSNVTTSQDFQAPGARPW